MSQLTNSYPVFEGNQVLTSSQLNQMVTYLDEQNRLTRVKLIGSGVVCGLELKLNTTSNPPLLNISGGLGVSSEGFLLSLGDCEINRYRTYTLPSGVLYGPFIDPVTKLQDVNLFEILSIDADIEDGTTTSFLNEPSGFLDDKVVLLFLEVLDADLKSCLGRSCDERGMNRNFIVRKLLVSKTDLIQKIIPRTCAPKTGENAGYDLPRFIIRRPRFEPSTPQSTDYNEFSKNYVNQIQGDGFISDFSTSNATLYRDLFEALRQTYTDFAGILAPVYGGTNPFSGLPDVTWTNFLNQQSTGPRYLGVQYFYDFIKDLILAYDEFCEEATALMAECCPDMSCFPKHLLLGEIMGSNEECETWKYRNYFAPSPAVVEKKDILDKIIMLHKRMVLMTKRFNLNLINNPSATPIPPSTVGQPVLITPSIEKQAPLSLRSIPYYYSINEPVGGLGTLEKNWSYQFIQKCLFKKGLRPLAYENQDSVQISDEGPIETPLYYDTDKYNFLRIEGAIRQNYVAVEQELEDLRSRFNLPFKYITVRLSGPSLEDIKERCNFTDLHSQYVTISTELKNDLNRLFNQIAVVRKGVELKPMPSFLSSLVNQADSGADDKGSVIQPQIGEMLRPSKESMRVDSNLGNSTSKQQEVTETRVEYAAQELILPVYAQRRSMQEAIQYFSTNILELARSVNTLTTEMLPFDLADFNFGYTGTKPDDKDGFIQTYLSAKQYAINVTVAQNQILDLVERSLKLNNSSELYATISSYFSENNTVFRNLIYGGKYRGLTLLNYTYQYRIQYLTQNDIKLFSNFIKRHPGISHQAGVPKGGTYIMVVNGDPVKVSVPSREYAIGINKRLKQVNVDIARLKYQPVKSTEEVRKMQYLEAEKLQLARVELALGSGVPVDQVTRPVTTNALEPDQVIADFTLPYYIDCDCICDEIPAPTMESELNIPAISEPYIASYSLGDYAYAKPVSKMMLSQDSTTRVSESKALYAETRKVIIDIKEAIQYDTNRYSPEQIRLYLVNKNGVKQPYATDSIVVGSQEVGMINTYNHPNDPGNTTQFGVAGVVLNEGVVTSIYYQPLSFFRGVDSFYYTFDIVDLRTGAVLQNGTRSVISVAAT